MNPHSPKTDLTYELPPELKPTSEDKMKRVVFFIEATSCEAFYLWKEYNKETNWIEDTRGFW